MLPAGPREQVSQIHDLLEKFDCRLGRSAFEPLGFMPSR